MVWKNVGGWKQKRDKMNNLKIAFKFVLLVLAQVYLFNQISLFGYALPFLYIYLIITLPATMNRSVVLLIAFFLGLSVDVFTNTYGLNASATVLAAFVRPYVQRLFLSREDFTDIPPSARVLGAGKFYKYAMGMVLVHHTAIFMVEYLSFFAPLMLLMKILFSSLFTLALIMGLESLFYNNKYH